MNLGQIVFTKSCLLPPCTGQDSQHDRVLRSSHNLEASCAMPSHCLPNTCATCSMRSAPNQKRQSSGILSPCRWMYGNPNAPSATALSVLLRSACLHSGLCIFSITGQACVLLAPASLHSVCQIRELVSKAHCIVAIACVLCMRQPGNDTCLSRHVFDTLCIQS